MLRYHCNSFHLPTSAWIEQCYFFYAKQVQCSGCKKQDLFQNEQQHRTRDLLLNSSSRVWNWWRYNWIERSENYYKTPIICRVAKHPLMIILQLCTISCAFICKAAKRSFLDSRVSHLRTIEVNRLACSYRCIFGVVSFANHTGPKEFDINNSIFGAGNKLW